MISSWPGIVGSLLLFLISPAQGQWGGIDSTFTPGGGNSAGFDLDVTCVALQSDGKIVVGGGFTQDGHTSRNRIARLNANGTLDTSFDPGIGASYTVEALALQPDGRVLVSGYFTAFNGVSHSYLARLNANGSLDATFNPVPNDLVAATALQPDGKILLVGAFTTVNGAPHDRIARLGSDGAVDPSFNTGAIADNDTFKPFLQAIALQPDGRVVIGGQFTHVGAVGRKRIARLNPDGSLDATFDPGSGPNKAVTTVALQPDGKILAGGSFTNVASATRYYVARLNNDGSLDTTFTPNIALGFGGLLAVQVEVDGKIFVGGDFASIDGFSRNDIARLNPDGSLDTTFDPGSGPGVSSGVPRVRALAVQPDGRVVVGGGFTTFNGVKLNFIARLLGDQGATVEFASASYSVDENGGAASVAVRRTGSTAGSLSLNYVTSDGTAWAGTDYVGQAGWVIFGPGDTNKVISIPILPDALIEGNESMNLTLGNPIGGEVLGNQKTATLTIIDNTNSVANHPPTLTRIPNQTVTEQTLLTFTVVASDLDGDTLTFSLDGGAPVGASINASSGVFSWTPTEAQGPSTNVITVRVSDNGVPSLSDTKSFTVVVDGLVDRDGDGMPDNYEIAHSLNPNDPNDAALDADGDGVSNLQEYQAGTDLDDPASRPDFAIEPSGNDMVISFGTSVGKIYRVDYSDSSPVGPWTGLQTVTGTGGIVQVVDVGALSYPKRFYRVVLVP